MTSPTYDDVRAALMRVRDAHREDRSRFCSRISREPIDPPDRLDWYVAPWQLADVEREFEPPPCAPLVVGRTLRARELGRLAKASADDVLTLERWLAARESA